MATLGIDFMKLSVRPLRVEEVKKEGKSRERKTVRRNGMGRMDRMKEKKGGKCM